LPARSCKRLVAAAMDSRPWLRAGVVRRAGDCSARGITIHGVQAGAERRYAAPPARSGGPGVRAGARQCHANSRHSHVRCSAIPCPPDDAPRIELGSSDDETKQHSFCTRELRTGGRCSRQAGQGWPAPESGQDALTEGKANTGHQAAATLRKPASPEQQNLLRGRMLRPVVRPGERPTAGYLFTAGPSPASARSGRRISPAAP
jgi:hypothetical protein